MEEKRQKFCSNVLTMSIYALTVTLVSLLMLSAQSARAQEYPTKPIEIVVPWGPGTGTDVIMRVISDIAPKYLGQPTFVTNKPGGAGSIGAADVIASKPDGYKLCAAAHAYFAGTVHTQKVPFDPSDLVPLAGFVELRQGMCVGVDSPFKTFNDLLQYVRTNPGQLKWSNPGRGVTAYITATVIFKKERVSTIDVPYKGGSVGALTALMGGHVDMASITGTGSSLMKAGKIRFLMYYSDRRVPDFPNVPTAAELGYPDAILPVYQGLFVHKNTPEHIKQILMGALKKVYDDPAFKKGIAQIDGDPRWCGPDFINESIKKSESIAVPILKELGLYVGK
jgi:tripartite-type tricarboxylate transporter receptor subunit TctC